ncbi:MAG: Gfo/Idh/MocA family oxidoreductase [Ignavibacteria bacterium]|nr:Gfo/Idh/MocA family oxidoreductase [Ignavibacteria bacterium]
MIGYGRRGKSIIGTISKRDDVSIEGIYDINENNQTTFNYNRYNDPEKMIKKIKPDIVIIASPPASHINYLDICNNYNIPAICEKPLASNLKELSIIKTYSSKIYIAYQLLYDKYINKMIELSYDNNIYSIEASQRVLLKPTSWKKNIDISGGGTLLDNCSHFINLAIFNFGLPRKLFSSLTNFENKIEKQSQLILFYDNFNFLINSSWLSAVGKENKITIYTNVHDIHYIEDNRFTELYTIEIDKNNSWSKKIKTNYCLTKGLERNIKNDPLNIISDLKALDLMFNKFLEDLEKKNSNFYKKQLNAAINTNEIIQLIYENPLQLIEL